MSTRTFVTTALASMVIAVTVGEVQTAEAQLIDRIKDLGRDIDRNRLDVMTPSSQPRAGRDYTKFYVKNNTHRTIKLSVHYHNDLDEYVTGYDYSVWKTAGVYELRPGQKAHVANTTGRYVYVAVQDRGQFWSGSHSIYHSSVGRKIPHFQHDLGGRFSHDYTLNLKD